MPLYRVEITSTDYFTTEVEADSMGEAENYALDEASIEFGYLTELDIVDCYILDEDEDEDEDEDYYEEDEEDEDL